ncbi:selenide, water dikinase SelD [Ovoidimarina sediminis]|uniref:selenide, water dikinase SelD n=1 Tax=Ovoidimarina sediminis TaxID=3079856 RepID=UPI002910ADCE|nr:selenide, water dikinase SelD [Rhodophyticola sp. MJ-SS7]MDU8945224.1 selenide, water dikinase SelD [Rhodophyticola sp. MJ-SS7]
MRPGADIPLTRDLVLIGGGHAHALVLRRWGMRPLPGARLTVINPEPTAPYTGMLPGHVAGHYPREALDIDLVRLCRFAGARLILGRADAIDRNAKQVHITGRGEIAYDVASIDVGITSDPTGIAGFDDHGVAAKPLGRFADEWAEFLAGDSEATVAVIGAGVGGVELAMAMHHALDSAGRNPNIAVIDRGSALSGLASRARDVILRTLRERKIRLIENTGVAAVGATDVSLDNGLTIAATLTVATAGARPWRWLSDCGLEMTDGFIDVDETLRSSDPAIYAVGDCANLTFAQRPKAGVYAVRAAPVLEANLRADLSGGASRTFRPQADYIKLISLGKKAAVGEKWGITFTGERLWKIKDRIDRKFMNKLSQLPAMPPPKLPSPMAAGVRAEVGNTQPMCAGCGSKVGRVPLMRALSRLSGAPERPDVTQLDGDDAAVLSIGSAKQVISVDHLRAFTDDPFIFARITACHALGDIWAMGARPQAALATLILPRMSEALQERWVAEIMEGSAAVLHEAGAVIAGGHTTMGAELTLGFTVTGLLDGPPITHSGAKPGDALVLTRPLGSGALLAAEMQLKARGEDIAGLLAEMAKPQNKVAELMTAARAMTDVTGFGLAGHLLNILDASGVGADLFLDSIPVYPGAREALDSGVRSTLAPANKAATSARLSGIESDILYDPQTAGGLLGAIPASALERTLSALASVGAKAEQIGTVTDGPPEIKVT